MSVEDTSARDPLSLGASRTIQLIPGSARVSRAVFGVSPNSSFHLAWVGREKAQNAQKGD
jgi:hypothetical protein